MCRHNCMYPVVSYAKRYMYGSNFRITKTPHSKQSTYAWLTSEIKKLIRKHKRFYNKYKRLTSINTTTTKYIYWWISQIKTTRNWQVKLTNTDKHFNISSNQFKRQPFCDFVKMTVFTLKKRIKRIKPIWWMTFLFNKLSLTRKMPFCLLIVILLKIISTLSLPHHIKLNLTWNLFNKAKLQDQMK